MLKNHLKMNRSKKVKVKRILCYVFWGFIFTLACVIYCITKWGTTVFDVGIESILFTLMNPMEGSSNEIVMAAVNYCLPRVLIGICFYVVLCEIDFLIYKKAPSFKNIEKERSIVTLQQVLRSFFSVYCVVLFIFSLLYVDLNYNVVEYFVVSKQPTTIYEDYYVDPKLANIQLSNSEGKKKNLIHIYLESMETINTSEENGGVQNVNYIPNLTSLALDNISFSNTDKLGGFLNPTNTAWTFSSLLAQTSGIPWSFPSGSESLFDFRGIADGMTNLGDILDSFGYNQMFLCGSDGNFAGRKQFFERHGNFEVFDYYSAIENGYIPKDYEVFWGLEDKKLFEIAKEQLTNLANKDEPFNFTMLTVDTHYPAGYICEDCDNEFSNQIENVYRCSDKKVFAFVDWLKTQDFFEDSVVIITGDHCLMNASMIERFDNYKNIDRTIYNCFINCKLEEGTKTTNRVFTPLDIFPTTLHVLGFTWDGDMLGLGTNMFSTSKTLAERLGFENLDFELRKYSRYYWENFY